MSSLKEVVDHLPHGENTILGQGGVRLSGGQRQRVALARAFYHGRDVIIMDESTSALDDDTEREIVKEIQSLKGIKTSVIIAHRLTTIKHCDQYGWKVGRSLSVAHLARSFQKFLLAPFEILLDCRVFRMRIKNREVGAAFSPLVVAELGLNMVAA